MEIFEEPIAVLPVRRVIFPSQLSSFAIGKKSSVTLVERLLSKLGLKDKDPERLNDGFGMDRATHLVIALARPEDPELGVARVGTAVRLLEIRHIKGVAPATADGNSSGAVYVIVVQGTERVMLDAKSACSEPFLHVRARKLVPSPGLDPDSATAWGLTLQALAHELLRGLQEARVMPPSGEAIASIAATVKDANTLLKSPVPGALRRLDFHALG